jgi:iron(III) transport system substrate-binding protein
MLRRAFTVLLSATFVASMSAGCGGSSPSQVNATSSGPWADVVAAANKEGQVTFYLSKAALGDAILKAFNKKYPDIKAGYVQMSSGPLAVRVDNEIKAGQVKGDLMMSADQGYMQNFAHAGNLLPADGPSAQLWDKKYIVDGSLVAAGFDPYVIAYNTELVKTRPKNWSDLAGQPNLVSALLDTSSTSTALLYYEIAQQEGQALFKKIASQHPLIAPSFITLTQSVASGEAAYIPFTQAWVVIPLREKGAPIDYVVPASPTRATVQYAGIHKLASHPNAARVLLDFIMSKEGQAILCAGGLSGSYLPNIPGALKVTTTVIPLNYAEANVGVPAGRQLFQSWVGR